MRVTLADICDVSSGFTARNRLDEAVTGVPVLQTRDVGDDPKIAPSGLMLAAIDGPVERYLVGSGDVVFKSKGERSVAAYLGDDFVVPAVAVLPVMILRVKGKVLPEFLVWSINQPEAQRHFDSDARSGTVRAVPKASIETLPISLPDLATQKKIIEVDRLTRKEAELSAQLISLRQRLVAEKLKALANDAVAYGVQERF
ncbi:restriction endonuclease subunit S [Neorhizobium galegae]|uniref:restriction endonuclease subunit S n=1 Tax=Neorhizobium galegae TaxID=399 RepID=UPI002103945F|nr:restriction endonuclease subunit S [Neorhizobium galegae]MCQ1769560.1 restriction endonuclease subunit S [Neorhizobium galegae]MCQ1849609.1 restriction endonuclease subunit S [Neorhizobium galegae]